MQNTFSSILEVKGTTYLDLVLSSCIALDYAGFLVLSHFPDTWFLPFYQGTFGLGILGTSWDSLEAGGMWKQEAWVPWKRVLLLLDSGDFLCFRVNVCGGQCCQGWSKAPGSQRCTKRKFPWSQWPCMVGKMGLSSWGGDSTGVTSTI